MSETNDLQAVIYEESSAHKMDFPLDFVNHMHIQRLAMLVICPQANIIRRIWILIYASLYLPGYNIKVSSTQATLVRCNGNQNNQRCHFE